MSEDSHVLKQKYLETVQCIVLQLSQVSRIRAQIEDDPELEEADKQLEKALHEAIKKLSSEPTPGGCSLHSDFSAGRPLDLNSVYEADVTRNISQHHPTLRTSVIQEWDEELCDEWIFAPDGSWAEPSERAEEEYQKKWRAFIAVRPPQELDLRLLGPKVREAARPKLYYGLEFRRENREACIERNKINVFGRETPGYSQGPDYLATCALEAFLSSKYQMAFDIVRPFSNEEAFFVVALDDTFAMRQNNPKVDWWRRTAPRVLDNIRAELGLGNQPAKWYWGSDFGIDYECPLLEYNPYQINHPSKRKRVYSGEESSDLEAGFCSEIDFEDEDEDQSEKDQMQPSARAASAGYNDTSRRASTGQEAAFAAAAVGTTTAREKPEAGGVSPSWHAAATIDRATLRLVSVHREHRTRHREQRDGHERGESGDNGQTPARYDRFGNGTSRSAYAS